MAEFIQASLREKFPHYRCFPQSIDDKQDPVVLQ